MPASTPPRDPLSATFAALAHPTRRAILARLIEGEAPVTELAAPFAMTLPAISKHLKVLERAHLIERSRHAQWRPCRLAPQPLKDVADWVERYRVLWDGRLDRLDGYLAELQRDPTTDRRHDKQPADQPGDQSEYPHPGEDHQHGATR